MPQTFISSQPRRRCYLNILSLVLPTVLLLAPVELGEAACIFTSSGATTATTTLALFSLSSRNFFSSLPFVLGEEVPTNDKQSSYDEQHGEPKYHAGRDSVSDENSGGDSGIEDDEEEDSEDKASDDYDYDYDYDYEDEDEDDEESEQNRPQIWEMTDEEILEHTVALPEDELLQQSYRNAQDKLFARIEWIENLRHPDRGIAGASFGEFLDAGTGPHSLKWIASIVHREKMLAKLKSGNEDEDDKEEETFTLKGRVCTPEDYDSENSKNFGECVSNVTLANYTAITAADEMRKSTLHAAAKSSIANSTNSPGDIIIGNWDDPEFLAGRKFDTILADYLIGAIDGFSPYFQDLIFERLIKHLKPGGRIYVVGLTPIPESLDGPENVFCKITRVRDACIKLGGDRCYREYPMDWILRHLKRAGLRIVDHMSFPITYSAETMIVQINVGRSKLQNFPTKGLADEMSVVLDELEEQAWSATENGPLSIGSDYVVTAELPLEENRDQRQSGEKKSEVMQKKNMIDEL